MVAFVVSLLAACAPPESEDSGTADAGPEPREYSDCDPIAYDYCALPYPSSFYLREDPTTVTGWRVHLGATTIPKTRNFDIQPDPAYWNELDGFSPMGPMLARFPSLSVDNLPGHDDIGASLLDDSNVVVFDAETGERQPVWAELDVSGDRRVGEEFLFIRPARPLANGRRFIVALRGLVDTTGAAIPPSDGFAALRDGTSTDDWDIEGRRDLYEEIFTKVEGQGWSRAETVLAWDFVVGSKEKITGRAHWMIEDALERVGNGGPAYTITSIEDYPIEENEHTARRIYGTFSAPLYTEEDDVGTMLTRDADGMPYYNGETTVPFTIVVPRTAETDPRPLKLLQYGHGLLGGQDEVHAGYLAEIADRHGYVIFAVDWTGMKNEDSDEIALMIVEDISRFAMIPERSHQGFAEFAVAASMMQGNMATDAALQYPDADGNLVSVVDPSEVYYYGNSQGAILGGAYVALSPVVQRATLGVGGMPYSLLLSRSADFTPFFALFQAVYPNQEDISFFMALMQNLWDSGEAGGYGAQMVDDPIDGTPPKTVLVQDAIGDAQVTTLGAHNMARAYGGALIEEPWEEVWGLEVKASGHGGSALVEYEHGAPAVPYENTPPSSEYDTHEDTRRTWAAQEQMATFFATGTVESYCDGVCDPE